MDRITPEQRRKTMQAIKSKGTKIENLLAKTLYANGIRYRRNVKSVFGCPDICIKKFKLAIFCDSEFWHGKNWEDNKQRIATNKEFWIKKIERNIQRDLEVNQKLSNDGWEVLRFWGNDILKQPDLCSHEIIKKINEKNERKA